MAHFQLACSHTRPLDQVPHEDLAALTATPHDITRYAWCDTCAAWSTVTGLVITPPHASDTLGAATVDTGPDHTERRGGDHRDDAASVPEPRLDDSLGYTAIRTEERTS